MEEYGSGNVSGETKRLVGHGVSNGDSNKQGNRKCCMCHSRTDSTCYRYAVMICLCMVSVGDYFCFDNPAALEEHILTELGITESSYMLFYSSIQWFQIGSCLFGGYLIDRYFGVRWSVFISTAAVTLSQSVFAAGALINSYWTMVMGRMIFGIAEGIQWLALEKMVVRWFKSKELTLVLGLKISLARAGTVVNMNVMGPIYSLFNREFSGHTSLGLTLLVGSGVCFVSTLFCSGLCFMDKKADTFLIETNASQFKDTVRLRIQDVKHFPLSFWLVSLTITFYLMTILSFTALGQVFFELKYGLQLEIASNVNSIVFIIGACVMPVVGITIDKVGRNLYWMFAGLIMQLSCHLLLAFTFVNPYVAMSILGISYSVASSALWPLITYVVHLDYIATAFGIVCTLISLGQAGNTYLAGYLAEYYGYITMEAVFLTYSCTSLVLGSLLYIVNSAQDGSLNLTTSGRQMFEENVGQEEKNLKKKS